jgi:hypothetical protein
MKAQQIIFHGSCSKREAAQKKEIIFIQWKMNFLFTRNFSQYFTIFLSHKDLSQKSVATRRMHV